MQNLQIDDQILNYNKIISRHISNPGNITRGQMSQDILSKLRHFVEHIILKVYAGGDDIEDSQDNIKKAVKYVKSTYSLRFLSQFHNFLQITVSHRILEEENSERLMLKYYEYLLRIRNYLHDEYSLDVLENLEQFPIEIDDDLNKYYEKIAERIDQYKMPVRGNFKFDRFYIQSIKPFFSHGKIYYEVAFIQANDKANKTDRIIAFTNMEISGNYAVKLAISDDCIKIFDKTMPIRVIVDWQVNIRPCEFTNFSKIFDNQVLSISKVEQKNINDYLTKTGLSLTEIILFSDDNYQEIRDRIVPQNNSDHFFDILDRCRSLVKLQNPGSNVIRYLLYHMTNRIIKKQYQDIWRWNYYEQDYEHIGSNCYLSNLYLAYECIPFDNMPFCTSLKGHVPSISDLFECLDINGREHELLAWTVRNNAEHKGMLFTPLEKNEDGSYKLGAFRNIDVLVDEYNGKLYSNSNHQARRLSIKNNHIFIDSYKANAVSIIQRIKNLTNSGLDNYSNFAKYWLQQTDFLIDDDKKNALLNMFVDSKVCVIYGPAGTGKTTLIKYISRLFDNTNTPISRIYLAQTNSAVNNLKRNAGESSNCEFLTINKFIKSKDQNHNCQILFIDECSTVSNENMKKVLDIAQYDLLVLVGDTYQIEAIEFGNWFDAVRNFLPDAAVVELTKPHRTDSQKLLNLWNSVRKMDDAVLDYLQSGEYSANLDSSIFSPSEENEIILCLSYGGLYGINNINHFMQENNTGKEIWRGVQRYKVGDPVIFNESADDFFRQDNGQPPLIHNNTKGRISDFSILDIDLPTERIQFDVEIDVPLIGFNEKEQNFEIVRVSENNNSVIRFAVYKNKSTDEDDDDSSKSIVPFQIAYAVSIHKAQGLEYDSVKVIITDEIDELITHSIFYTAITRARKKLKIYWTQAVERKVLDRIEHKSNQTDVAFLKKEII
ncbi:MAG: ATP-dependent RecD-like DNA helicase [Oscillospiraceae bacterium]